MKEREIVIIEDIVYEINVQASCFNLRKKGLTWQVIADRLGIRHGKNASSGAIRYARQHGLKMPEVYNKPGRKVAYIIADPNSYIGKNFKEQCAIRKAERESLVV